MADTEETPAQRQARIRREKREAKIKGTAQERLTKITALSGRTPEMMETVSPTATPPRTASPAIAPPASTHYMSNTSDPEQARFQEEYLRALMQNQNQTQTPQQPVEGPGSEDPMMKMLSDMMSGMGGIPGMQGMGVPPNNDDPNASGMPSFDQAGIAKAMGIPPFLVDMVLGKKELPKSPAQQKEARNWTILHILFATVAGLYVLFTLSNLTGTFGEKPPAPATIQNPFVVFLMGEMVLHGSRTVLSTGPRKEGMGFWVQIAKDTGRDASVMIFLLGARAWWQGLS